MYHSFHALVLGALGLVPCATAVTNIWLAGDSTMAEGGGGTGTQGWGHYLQYSFDSSEYVVNNEAVAGRSARSYWQEGRFQDIADEISAGDVGLAFLFFLTSHLSCGIFTLDSIRLLRKDNEKKQYINSRKAVGK